MIIIGYQGIGKSTLANKDMKFVDLESGSFWYTNQMGEKTRHLYWYECYCNVAEHLSAQGYDVFVSSHKEVRERLQNSSEHVIAVVPSINLKTQWIAKLKSRYDASSLEKDYKAWLNAQDRYEENIKEIQHDYPNYVEIKLLEYDLKEIIDNYHINYGAEWRDIKGFEGYYQISSKGQVKAKKRLTRVSNVKRRNHYYEETWERKEKLLKPIFEDGEARPTTARVRLYKEGSSRRDVTIKRLIAENFFDDFDPNTTTNQIKLIDPDKWPTVENVTIQKSL